MKLYTDLDELPADFRAGAVTIGNFDGVHRGHARLLQRLTDRAAQFGGPAVVFTFAPHPVQLLRPHETPAPLTWTTRKAALLGMQAVDIMIAYPTTHEFLALTPAACFQQIVCDRLSASAMVEGPNFRFGQGRAGTTETLQRLCTAAGISLDIVSPVVENGAFISSSRIRDALAAGDVDAANGMLTQPYRIRGQVTHGAGRGRRLGFATANLSDVQTLIPGAGVYAGRAEVQGKTYQAAINIGSNPTFGEHQLKIEVHLLDFSGSIYGDLLEVDVLHRIRDVETFASLEQLKKQLRMDLKHVRETV